ncbi:MAG TPA: hypothetical protein VK251_12825 [Steroidobacteraceae bacterium]|nr:hypothetical protein [Steroidobacteraceae bacterium]
MPRGSKTKYMTKQQDKACHIKESYEGRGVAPKRRRHVRWRL